MVLHLDKDFKPYTDQEEVEYQYFTFSGGEPHIKISYKLESVKEVHITHRVRSFNDMGILFIAINALRNMDVRTIHLVLPYFPAARQDRLMVSGEALTVKVYAELFNSLTLDSITIFDPHSEVTPALLNNCKVIDNHSYIKEVIKQLPSNTLLISPDGGALKKIYKLAAYLKNYQVVECSKTRDVRTGSLSGFKVYADDLKGQDCLIVDDICDGGGTFLGLAKSLKAANAGSLHLAVSHGIFSKGFEALTTSFKTIFTTNSFKNFDTTDQVQQLKLNHGLLS